MVAVGFSGLSPDRKRAYVRTMFSAIARRYDLLNSLLSFGLHKRWKRYAADCAAPPAGGAALDVCCGTGDLAFLLHHRVGPRGRVVGVDFAAPMVQLAVQRAAGRAGVWFVQGDAEALPLQDATFDVATVGFGVRNVGDVEWALRELWRVLKPGGRLVVLEFSQPQSPLFAFLYGLYSRAIPWVGRKVSRHPDAYRYLTTSIRGWLQQEVFSALLQKVGFHAVRYRNLLCGAVAVHVGEKSADLGNHSGGAEGVEVGLTSPEER